MPTPHISAPDGAFAPTVLLPGDPLRAKWIAETFLDDAELVTEVRNIFGYTGTWNGNPVSVMGTGMGVPSISIYATELITQYGCERLIRVGSCGALIEAVGLRDVVIGAGACTDSGVNRVRFGGFDYAAIADWSLLRSTAEAAERGSASVHVGNIMTSDLFYSPKGEEVARMAASMGVLAVEMEAAGLYGVAAEHGAAALAICTVSDHLVLEQVLTPEERQQSFSDMIEIALAGAFA
ncbi:MAG: purine-nucleoside phosphorylase [Actinomycetota bacterium]